MTKFQARVLKMVAKGYGLSAAPRAISASQRADLDELVGAGLLVISKNHSGDKHGCYAKPDEPTPGMVRDKIPADWDQAPA